MAVDDLSLTVKAGEIVGLLGPNGAGKSTTMRMIAGCLPPSCGSVRVGGYDVVREPLSAKSRLGYLPEGAAMYGEMTVTGFLRFVAEVRGFSGRAKAKRVDEIIERCHLSDVRHQSIATLSKGYNQRTCLAQCIIHDPGYLIMDEPTGGMDPNEATDVRNTIRELGSGKGILVTTHILEEADAICTRIVVMMKGRFVFDGTTGSLRALRPVHGAARATVRSDDLQRLLLDMRDVPRVTGVVVVDKWGDEITFRAHVEEPHVGIEIGVLERLLERGYSIQSFRLEEADLYEAFREATQARTGGAARFDG